jgi:hypothetical protein
MASLLELMMVEGESGGGGAAGYTTAFTHPDPLDPNDKVRQKTQTRSAEYPYDMPVMYGRPSHASFDGDERQDGSGDDPPLGRQSEPDRPLSVWDRMSDLADSLTRESAIGSGYESEVDLGLGSHGRMGEDGMDAFDLEMDALRRDFRSSYDAARPVTDRMDSPKLFVLLTRMDPDFAADTFAPEDEEEMRGIYSLWADRMSGLEGQEDEDFSY